MSGRFAMWLPAWLALVSVAMVACRSDQPRPGGVVGSPPPSSDTAAVSASGRTPAAAEDRSRLASQTIMWDRLGAWAGKTSMQTESFTGATGALRIVWTTKNPTAADGGSFRLTIHSAISGRPLDVAVDQRGPGADTAYVTEDPRAFFAVVDASNLEWAFTVDEAVQTRRRDDRR